MIIILDIYYSVNLVLQCQAKCTMKEDSTTPLICICVYIVYCEKVIRWNPMCHSFNIIMEERGKQQVFI